MKNNGIKFFLLYFLLFFAYNAKSQVDSKYLTGAVPEVNGKVIFSDTIAIPGLSQNELYARAYSWSEANYNAEQSRIAYSDKAKGIISCKGETELIFSASALSLDKALMQYQLNIFCSEGHCRTELKSITYNYFVSSQKDPIKYTAEEWITDKESVNKNKLYRNSGKFRIKTIDLIDDIYNSLGITLSSGKVDLFTEIDKSKSFVRKQTGNEQTQPTSSKQTQQPIATTSTSVPLDVNYNSSSEIETLSGYKKLDPEKIPGNIIKMLNNDWMLITAGNESQFNMMTASWGGLGVLWSKPVAFCFINPARYTYQLMEKGDMYTLSFYTEAYRDALKYCGSNSGKDTDKVKGSGLTPITLPSGCKSFSEAWMIIECKKIYAEQINGENVFDPKVKEEWSKSQFHKMYIGEILNVWIK